jgi:hypothetical protein
MTQSLQNRHFRCEENYTHSYYVAEWWNSISVKSWFSSFFFQEEGARKLANASFLGVCSFGGGGIYFRVWP